VVAGGSGVVVTNVNGVLAPALTTTVKLPLAISLDESVTVTSKVNGPETGGIPLSKPEELRLNQDGKFGDDHV
jgi:hypothetical protein